MLEYLVIFTSATYLPPDLPLVRVLPADDPMRPVQLVGVLVLAARNCSGLKGCVEDIKILPYSARFQVPLIRFQKVNKARSDKRKGTDIFAGPPSEWI